MVQKVKNTDTVKEEQIIEEKELVVTQATDWNSRNTNERLLQLPSGDVFRVRDVSLPNMVTKGIIPLNLTTQLMKMKENIEAAVKAGKNESEGIAEEEFKDIDGICRNFALLAVIQPVLVENHIADSDTICVHDIDFMDIMFLFSKCVRGGAEQFASFF